MSNGSTLRKVLVMSAAAPSVLPFSVSLMTATVAARASHTIFAIWLRSKTIRLSAEVVAEHAEEQEICRSRWLCAMHRMSIGSDLGLVRHARHTNVFDDAFRHESEYGISDG